MRRTLKLALPAGLLVVLFLMALPTAGASASATGPCNEATATTLGEEYDLNPFAPITRQMSPLCGEFLGSGSEALIARAIPSTCGGYAGWAAFRHEADGSWQLVSKYRNGQLDLESVGNDLEETLGILGPNDARCVGEKSTKTRVWHWDGQQFVAGSWTVHLKSGLSAFLAKGPHFALPCVIADTPANRFNGASCKSGKLVRRRVYTQKADLRPSGQVKICKKYGVRSCGGAPCGCDEDFVKVLPGEQVVTGRFTCQVLRNGVNCFSAPGQGFFMNQSKAMRL